MTDKDQKNAFHCSFCGKSQYKIRKLIAGPKVFICDECVFLSMDIITDEEFKAGTSLGKFLNYFRKPDTSLQKFEVFFLKPNPKDMKNLSAKMDEAIGKVEDSLDRLLGKSIR